MPGNVAASVVPGYYGYAISFSYRAAADDADAAVNAIGEPQANGYLSEAAGLQGSRVLGRIGEGDEVMGWTGNGFLGNPDA